ncbi:MAG: hypothetical protein AB1782_17250 [Cyanobacteriota bacterium]
MILNIQYKRESFKGNNANKNKLPQHKSNKGCSRNKNADYIKINAKEDKDPPTQKKKINIPYITALISAATQLFGGACLAISALLPAKSADIEPPVIPQSVIEEHMTQSPGEMYIEAMPENITIQETHTKQLTPDEINQQAQNTMNNIKDILNKMGWASLAIGNVTSGIGIAGMGSKFNQPSILLGGLGVLGCAPIMVIDPSIPLRGALCVFLATFFSGFANKIRNDFELKPGDTPREFDLSFLKEGKSWKGALTNRYEAQQFASKTYDMMKFVAKDQVMLLTSAGRAVDQSVKKLFGIRKELPDFMTLKPSSEQRRISSMLVYAGGLPLLAYGGSIEALTPIANALIGAGFSTGNLGMFAIGNKQEDSTRPALLIGVPLKFIGDFMITKDYGFGLSQMGSASHNYYVAVQNKKMANKADLPQAQKTDNPEKTKKTKKNKPDNELETKNLKQNYKALERKELAKTKQALKYHDKEKGKQPERKKLFRT